MFSPSLFAQAYYLRGEVKDENGNILQNVKIIQEHTGYVYKTGTTGGFGITVYKQIDSFTFKIDGFKEESLLLNAKDFQLIVLQKKTVVQTTMAGRQRRSAFSKNEETMSTQGSGNESYAKTIENPQVDVSLYPAASLAIDMDKASYSNVRRFLMQHSRVPPDAIRVEEMVNYFSQVYYTNPGDSFFSIRSARTECPWNSAVQLLHINVSSRKISIDSLPPSHLVFLIDISVSMDMPGRLQLLKYAFNALADNLREKDSISIVVYGGVTGVMLEACSGKDKKRIMSVVNSLQAGGFTPGESGIKWAYNMAKKHFIVNGNNRIILATDGDFNVGVKSDEELDSLIEKERGEGIYLTCLGVGVGNYKDSKIQTVAHKGNGNYAYLDNVMEAEKVLVKELTQSLYTVADDVYMDVKFNPETVKSYKLLGYENNAEIISDSSTQINGGEIGSGFSMMALFEIEPINKNVDSLKQEQLATINLSFKKAGDTCRQQLNVNVVDTFSMISKVDKAFQLATSVCMYALLLKHSGVLKKSLWKSLALWVPQFIDADSYLQQEFLSLINTAQEIYTHRKK